MNDFKIYLPEIKYSILVIVAKKLNMNYIAVAYESSPNCKQGDTIDLIIKNENNYDKIIPVKVLSVLPPEPLTKAQKKKLKLNDNDVLIKILGPEISDELEKEIKAEIADNSVSWFLILELPQEELI